jgi:hypothetical protein
MDPAALKRHADIIRQAANVIRTAKARHLAEAAAGKDQLQ